MNGRKNPQSEWIITIDFHPAIIENRVWEIAQELLGLRRDENYFCTHNRHI
ncbi:recombinase family protein [Gorillibacterium timonense]|uniref:recombinase family protein n=1 Tax=Gorillibacterium timonense TaxID=1689269 RepID=UPI003709BD21